MAPLRRKLKDSEQLLIAEACHASLVNAAVIYEYWLNELPRPDISYPSDLLTSHPSIKYQLMAIHQTYRDCGLFEVRRIAHQRPACTKGGKCIDVRKPARGGCSVSEHHGLTSQRFRVDVIRRSFRKGDI